MRCSATPSAKCAAGYVVQETDGPQRRRGRLAVLAAGQVHASQAAMNMGVLVVDLSRPPERLEGLRPAAETDVGLADLQVQARTPGVGLGGALQTADGLALGALGQVDHSHEVIERSRPQVGHGQQLAELFALCVRVEGFVVLALPGIGDAPGLLGHTPLRDAAQRLQALTRLGGVANTALVEIFHQPAELGDACFGLVAQGQLRAVAKLAGCVRAESLENDHGVAEAATVHVGTGQVVLQFARHARHLFGRVALRRVHVSKRHELVHGLLGRDGIELRFGRVGTRIAFPRVPARDGFDPRPIPRTPRPGACRPCPRRRAGPWR